MQNTNLSKVVKVGNSLAIIIPVAILRDLKIGRGDRVVFGVYDENTIAVRRVPPEELQKIKPQNLQF